MGAAVWVPQLWCSPVPLLWRPQPRAAFEVGRLPAPVLWPDLSAPRASPGHKSLGAGRLGGARRSRPHAHGPGPGEGHQPNPCSLGAGEGPQPVPHGAAGLAQGHTLWDGSRSLQLRLATLRPGQRSHRHRQPAALEPSYPGTAPPPLLQRDPGHVMGGVRSPGQGLWDGGSCLPAPWNHACSRLQGCPPPVPAL